MSPRVPLPALTLLALVAGCAGDGTDVRSAGDGGTIAFSPRQGLEVDVEVDAADEALRIDLRARNGSDRTYGYKDDCSERWYRFTVLDGEGEQVYPGLEVACDLYSVPAAFGPGGVRSGTLAWRYEVGDVSSQQVRPAPPGTYTVRVEARFYEGPGEGRPSFTGHLDVPVTLA